MVSGSGLLEIAAFSSAVIWAYLLLARGGFWFLRERDDRDGAASAEFAPGAWPPVVAVMPARNEAPFVARSVGSLLRQDYPGLFQIVLVDDGSADGTAGIAQAVARGLGSEERLRVIRGRPVPEGWTGKLWAIQQGSASVQDGAEYLLFTDADIVHASDNLRKLVARASKSRLTLVSVMAKLRCESRLERAVMPAFVFFFDMLFPFAWVNRPRCRTAAAAGGCMLVRRSALDAAGGIAPIREEIIDDCALARRLKRQGPVWLGLSEHAVSLRPCQSFGDVRGMITRSAYAQLGYSPCLLAATIVVMALAFWAPPVVAVIGFGSARFSAVAAWSAMALALVPMLRFYRLSPLWGFAFPAIATLYMVFTIDSAVQHWRGRGGMWKGRAQAVR